MLAHARFCSVPARGECGGIGCDCWCHSTGTDKKLPGPEYWDRYFGTKRMAELQRSNAHRLERAAETILVAFRQAQGLRCCDAHETGHIGGDHGFIGGARDALIEHSYEIDYLLSLLPDYAGGTDKIRQGVKLYREESETWASEEFNQFRCALNHRGQP